MPGRIRGVGLKSIVAFLRAKEGAALVDRIFADLTPEHRPGIAGFLAASSYDMAILDALLRGYVLELERTGRGATVEPSLRTLGVFVAEDNLNSVFKIVLSLATPRTFIEKLPTLWSLYFSDVDVRASLSGPNAGRFVVSGVTAGYLNVTACGWIEFGLAKVGAKPPIACREEGWSAGHAVSPHAVYTVSWA